MIVPKERNYKHCIIVVVYSVYLFLIYDKRLFYIIMFFYYCDVLRIQMLYGGIMDQWNKCMCVCVCVCVCVGMCTYLCT